MTDKPKPEDAFTNMAARISRNDPGEFAGAYVIVAPDGSVTSQSFFNPVGDTNAFWGFVSATVETASTEAMQKSEAGFGGMGGRRQR